MGNWKWIVGGVLGLGLLVGGTVALGQSAGQQVEPEPTATVVTTSQRVKNCESWHVYSAMANIDFPYADEDDCKAAVLEDATKFTAPPTDDQWDAVTG